MGARLEEAHGTGGEQHARTNTHAIHTSSLSLSLPNKSSSQPFFFLAMFRQKAKLKIENSKMK
jgi:hypothetical protein